MMLEGRGVNDRNAAVLTDTPLWEHCPDAQHPISRTPISGTWVPVLQAHMQQIHEEMGIEVDDQHHAAGGRVPGTWRLHRTFLAAFPAIAAHALHS